MTGPGTLTLALLLLSSTAVAQGPKSQKDREGEPLPSGALLRLGTTRLRHGVSVHTLAFSPDGKKLASGGDVHGPCFWHTRSGRLLLRTPSLQEHPHIHALVFSPDGKLVATAEHELVRLRDSETGKLIRELKGHKEWVKSLMFSPDGSAIATVGADGLLKLWNPTTGKSLWNTFDDGTPIKSIAISPDGKRV